jgi:putative tricarboxylic transport membrane protein
MFGTIALLLIAPLLSRIALKFGPPETFMLSVFGLTIIASVSSKNMIKGILSGLIGLLLSTIGFDAITGYPRFAFGNINLYEGVALVVALVGFFSIPEALTLVKAPPKRDHTVDITIDRKSIENRLTGKELLSLIPTFIRGAVIGTAIGIIPGVGTPVACFLAYNEEKRFSKHPERFGTGIIEGVAAPETANNAVEGGSFVPLLTLGIPGSSQTAVYVGALLILGIKPGPELFTAQAPMAYSIILGLFLANVMMLFIGLGGIRFFVKIIKLPNAIMIPVILTFTIIGSYAIKGSIFDVGLMLVLGLIGYLMRVNSMPVAPTVLALILGPIGENAFLQTLSITHGQPWMIFTRPICLVLLAITVLSIVFSMRKNRIVE